MPRNPDRLKEAAPEMYDLLQAFVLRMEVLFTRGDFDSRDEAITRKLVNKAKAIMDKVEGPSRNWGRS